MKTDTSSLTYDKIRIAKVISRRGYCSRREAEKHVQNGNVTVNGVLIQDPAIKIDEHARITINGHDVPVAEKTRLWLFNKPKGCLTTSQDPQGRKTIFHFLTKLNHQHLIPVGRLDYNSEGLLLLTNDGSLASYLMHPKTQIKRCYEVDVFGKLDPTLVHRLAKRIKIKGINYKPVLTRIIKSTDNNHQLMCTLTEGKNREIRRLMEVFGLKVKKLRRVSYGPYRLGSLNPGNILEGSPRQIYKK